MATIDIGQNLSDYLNIQLHSEAFEDGVPFFYKTNPKEFYTEIADIHKILYRLGKNKPLSINVFYEPITDEYLNDLVDLHKEWFPFQYDRNYFKKFIVRKNNIAMGAFLKFGNKNYLIGCVLGEIITEQKFRHLLPGILLERSWYDFISSWVDCVYLHSIGVIDEYRKLSIGTKLMDLFIEECKKKAIVAVYLNIIIHNKAAIKFVEENNWHYFGIAKNNYKYNDNLYDAKTYYYVLDMNWCQLNETTQNNDNSNSDGIQEIPRKNTGCAAALYGMLNIFSGQNANKEEESDISNLKKINVDDEDSKI